MRYVIYARYSSVGQNPLSIEHQVSACREAAESRGWEEVAGPFTDAAKSGYRGGEASREGLALLFDYLRSGDLEGGYIYVWSTSRLARQWGFMLSALIEAHDRHGVQIVDCEFGSYDLSTVEGRLMLSLRASMDEEYSSQLSRRIKLSHDRLRSGGYHIGRVPFGAAGRRTLEGIILEPHPVQHPVLLELFERATWMATADLVRWFNAQPGARRPSGSEWSRYAVYWILRNPVYIGMIRHKGVLSDGRHDPLVPPGLFAQVQRARENWSNPAYPEKRAAPRKHPLAGRVYCKCCGEPCYRHSRAIFRCRSSAVPERDTCAAPGWARDRDLHLTIFTALAAGLEGMRGIVGAAAPPDVSGVDREIAELQGMAERLTDAIAEGSGTLKPLVTRLQNTEQKLSSLMVKRAEILDRNSVSSLFIKACEIVQNANPAGLPLLVHRVDLGSREEGRITVYTVGGDSSKPMSLNILRASKK